MYDYYFDHWEVRVVEKAYIDGFPMVTTISTFENEDEAIAFARENYAAGREVSVKVVQIVEGWVDIYEALDESRSKH